MKEIKSYIKGDSIGILDFKQSDTILAFFLKASLCLGVTCKQWNQIPLQEIIPPKKLINVSV